MLGPGPNKVNAQLEGEVQVQRHWTEAQAPRAEKSALFQEELPPNSGINTPPPGAGGSPAEEISSKMSEVGLRSSSQSPPGHDDHPPQALEDHSSSIVPVKGGEELHPRSPITIRTPSPAAQLESSVLFSRSKADQMDAIPPPGIRTPRKSPVSHSPLFASRPIITLEPLPRFTDVSESQWSKLFTKKISQAEVLFDFNMPLFDTRNKELKAMALTDLLWMVTEHTASLGEQQYAEIFIMFAKNTFRSLPPRQNPVGEIYDPEDDEPVYDSSWPHSHLVYEIFIRLVEATAFNVNIARRFVDQLFVHRLLTLFDVEDPREREMVKTAVHRVYGKFLNLRAFIRKSMRHIFYEFVYEDERHNIAEMLEILGSIINGFAVPLREEHKIFLEKTLIPLHKNRILPLYYQQLSLCIVQFAEKDPKLVEKIVPGLLKIWPKINTTKEIMFLSEIEEVLDVVPTEQVDKVLVPLCRQLSRSLSSFHFQVAERALQFWGNENIIALVSQRTDEILPIVLPSMLQYARTHWNKYDYLYYGIWFYF